jgi:tripartite-type tricarboxylate transporter receptor subunit TctC
VKERIAAGAGELFDMPVDDMTPFVRAEIAKWADVVKRAGIQVQQ